jgi:hypothetical protein
LHELRVEFDLFHLDATKWHPPLIPFGPGQHIPDPGEQGGWEPAFGTPTIQKPWLAVAQVGATATTTIPPSLVQMLFDGIATMDEVSQMQGMMHVSSLRFLDTSQGYSRRFASGIKFQHHRL